MADKIAMYIRLSEEDYDVKKGLADESNSIKSQRMLLKSYINNHSEFNGWDVGEYFDDGTSGTLFRKRDEFQSMIEDAQNGCFNCLIVKDLSRFGRDYLEVGYYTEMLLPMLNIRFISVNDGYDSNNYKGTTGGMEYALKNLMHQLYSMDMSKKTKSAFETRRKAGQCVIPHLPYGYRRNPDKKGEILVVENEAEVVKEIFEMAAKGYKASEIAKTLNLKGIPTNRKTKGIWNTNIIMKKIRNEFYIGNLIQGRLEVVGFGDSKKTVRRDPSRWSVTKGAVPAIISEELFKAANANFPVIHRKKGNTGIINLFKCGYCGKKVYNEFGKRYACRYKYVTDDENCLKVKMASKKAEQAVLDTVKDACRLMLDRYDIIQREDEYTKDGIRTSIKELENEKVSLEKAPMSLYKKYKAQALSREEFMLEKEKANLRLSEVERQIAELTTQLADTKEPVVEKQDLLNCSQLDSYDSKILSQIIQEVRIYGEDSIEVIFKCNDFYVSCLQALGM